MNKKSTFGSLLTLAALLFQSLLLPQPVVAASCADAAQFVADVTIPDGTVLSAGQAFTKTWRLKNVGTCTWTTNYSLVFVSGDPLGLSAGSTVPVPQDVVPGATIDVSVPMTAPGTSGTFTGNWELKNAAGGIFGIGFGANKVFWVKIVVSGTTATGFDYVQSAPSAAWSSGAGALTFPGSVSDSRGSGQRVDNPRLENGSVSNAPGLLMVPQNLFNGFVQAEYPSYHVRSGDHFQSIINCAYLATACYVNFRLDYKLGLSSTVFTFWTFNERYDGLFYSADRDLSSLAGQDVKFILRVGAVGSAAGDQALWGSPRIININNPGPTSTITPTVTGTPPTPTSTLVASSGCDRATFIGDFNVPDGTVYGPNRGFTKTWSIKNTGTCIWTNAYKLVFFSGDPIGGPQEQNLVSTIGPNTTVQISVGLTSPGTNGHYRGYWMLKNAAGALFGIGPGANKPFWVDIIVTGGNNFTPTPTLTGTPPTPTPTGNGPTTTPTPNSGPDRAAFVADLTIPDGTGFGPNVTFTKTWRLLNTGSSTWTNAYKLVFYTGSQMSGPNEQSLTSNVSPGHTIDLSVSLAAPNANGTYRGYWMLKNPSGQLFGIGGTANRPFWVDIFVSGASSAPDLTVLSVLADGNQGCFSSTFKTGVRVVIKNNGSANVTGSFVVDVNGVQQNYSAGLAAGQSASLWFDTTGTSATAFVDATNLVAESNENNNKLTQQLLLLTAPPPCATSTLTPTPGTRTSTPTATGTGLASSCDRASMIADITIPDDTIFGPNTNFTKTWRLQNVGSCTWTTAYQLVFASGSQMGGPSLINLPTNVAPGGTVDLSVTLISPAANGTYRGNWQLKNASGTLFGIGTGANSPFWVEIMVQGGSAGPTATVTRTPAPGVATSTGTATATTASASATPTATNAGQPSGPYAVFGIESNFELNVFPTPGFSGTPVASLAYNVNNLTRTGATSTVSSGEWWQISLPGGGTGWLHNYYLTEYIPPATFCADGRVAALLANLGNVLKTSDGTALGKLVSPDHGLQIYLASSNAPINYTSDSASVLFTSTSIQNWGPAPASGQTVSGTFKDVILPKLSDVYNSTFTLGCNDLSKVGAVSQPWPSEFTSINFYSVYKPATTSGGQDWRDVLVGIEYVKGQPYLFALINFEWVP